MPDRPMGRHRPIVPYGPMQPLGPLGLLGPRGPHGPMGRKGPIGHAIGAAKPFLLASVVIAITSNRDTVGHCHMELHI